MEPLTVDALSRLNAYDWPGNVRELQNVIERSAIIAEDGRPNLDRALPVLDKPSGGPALEARVLTINELQELEKQNIVAALEKCNWRVAGNNGAANLLGMKPSTLNSRIAALGLKKR